jgi:Ca-activated chloride channel homolog
VANVGIRAFVVGCLFVAATLSAQVCQIPSCERTLVAASTTAPLAVVLDGRAPYTFRSRVDEVSLTFSVTDNRGQTVSTLNSDDLTVFDSNLLVKEVRLVTYGHLRMRVGMLIDWSDSLKDRRSFERQAATDFLRRIMRPEFDDGFVMAIGVKPQLTQRLTSDPEEMAANITAANDAWLTSLYDAIVDACRGEISRPMGDAAARRAIVLLSDGQDTDSMHALEDAIRAAQHADVAIFPIGGADEVKEFCNT